MFTRLGSQGHLVQRLLKEGTTKTAKAKSIGSDVSTSQEAIFWTVLQNDKGTKGLQQETEQAGGISAVHQHRVNSGKD